MKIIIKYARSGAVRYISHLDMQRAFGRALRRAQVPVGYSQGFNPHIVMSFASPLSVGYATNGDYLEVAMASEMKTEEIMDRLNAALPPEIKILAVKYAQNNKKLMAMNHSAKYCITFCCETSECCDKIKQAVEEIKNSEAWLTLDRKGREVDIRPLIGNIKADGCAVQCVLCNSSEKALNPAVLANAICKKIGEAPLYSVCREECYAKDGQTIAAFCEI